MATLHLLLVSVASKSLSDCRPRFSLALCILEFVFSLPALILEFSFFSILYIEIWYSYYLLTLGTSVFLSVYHMDFCLFIIICYSSISRAFLKKKSSNLLLNFCLPIIIGLLTLSLSQTFIIDFMIVSYVRVRSRHYFLLIVQEVIAWILDFRWFIHMCDCSSRLHV